MRCFLDTWYGGLLSDTKDVIARLMAERLHDVDTLRDQVHNHHLRVKADAGPLTDVDSAGALHRATMALLERTSSSPARVRRLAQVAARYFVVEDDGDDDMHSPYGFDDDVEVFNAVVREIGQPEYEIAY